MTGGWRRITPSGKFSLLDNQLIWTFGGKMNMISNREGATTMMLQKYIQLFIYMIKYSALKCTTLAHQSNGRLITVLPIDTHK
jgi:hypothetical protein